MNSLCPCGQVKDNPKTPPISPIQKFRILSSPLPKTPVFPIPQRFPSPDILKKKNEDDDFIILNNGNKKIDKFVYITPKMLK